MCVGESEVLFWMNAQNISCKSRRSRQQIRVSLERSPGESFRWIFPHESGWSYSTCQRTAKEVIFGFAEWQISTSCWIEVSRNEFASANGLRTSFTFRRWHWTTHVLQTKPGSVRLVTWIPGYDLPRKSIRFTNTHCSCRKWEFGEPYVAKVHGRCFLRGTVDARANLHIFAKSVEHGTMWNARMTSSIKMVHHATYQKNPW